MTQISIKIIHCTSCNNTLHNRRFQELDPKALLSKYYVETKCETCNLEFIAYFEKKPLSNSKTYNPKIPESYRDQFDIKIIKHIDENQITYINWFSQRYPPTMSRLIINFIQKEDNQYIELPIQSFDLHNPIYKNIQSNLNLLYSILSESISFQHLF